MDDKCKALRKQLNCLGYVEQFSRDSFPLVEKLVADLIQTSCSLQYYTKVSNEALRERDAWKIAGEPYKCENANLIKDNNKLHMELLRCKEEAVEKLRELNSNQDALRLQCERLKHQNAKLAANKNDGINAPTISSSKKINQTQSKSACPNCIRFKSETEEISQELSDRNHENCRLTERNSFIKSQVNERDKEIKRLNRLLESGRPIPIISSSECDDDCNIELARVTSRLFQYEETCDSLNKQLKESFDKQHEAMNRAIQLAEKNQLLEKHIKSTDEMAFKVEEECNAKLKKNRDAINSFLQKITNLTQNLENANSRLKEVNKLHEECAATIETKSNTVSSLTKALHEVEEENSKLLMKNEELLRAQRSLQNKLELKAESDDYLYQLRSSREKEETLCGEYDSNVSKVNLLKVIEKERKYYEGHLQEIKNKLNDQIKINTMYKESEYDKLDFQKLKDEKDFYFKEYNDLKNQIPHTSYLPDLHSKINQLEQYNGELKRKVNILTDENYNYKREIDGGKRIQRDYESERHSRSVLEHMERDLSASHRERRKIEAERDDLLKKLQDLNNSEATYRRLYDSLSSKEVRADNLTITKLQKECDELRANLKASECDLMHTKSLYNQLKSLQTESDRNVSGVQSKLNDMRQELISVKSNLATCEKQKNDLEYEMRLLKTDKAGIQDNMNRIDKERDRLIMDVDDKTEKLSALEHQLRTKTTSIELLENKIIEYNRKTDLLTNENTSLEHKFRDCQTRSEALSLELDTITKQRDNALIENRRLQSDLAAVNGDLRTLKREYENSRKEVEEMKQQLQHYVDEVRRIEDILSRKEAERTEMLDHFASLSHEQTVLESNNHSLENEAASKSAQLLAVTEKLSETEKKLKSRETLVEMQEEKIASLLYKISTLEHELTIQKDIVKNTQELLNEAQEMCSILENQKKSILIGVGETDSARKDIEHELAALKKEQRKLEDILAKEKTNAECLETLLVESRREVVELKMSLKDAIEENKTLKQNAERFRRQIDIVENESLTGRLRSEEAAKQLQDLHHQMSEARYHRVRHSSTERKSAKSFPSGTL